MGDCELTKRKYLPHNTTASTPLTTANIIISAATTTKAKTSTINSTVTSVTTGATTTATKTKGIKAKLLGNI